MIMKKNFFGRSKVDVENPGDYIYLDPLWKVLENTPSQGITAEQMGKESGLDPSIAVPMVQDLVALFQRKMMKILVLGDLSEINPDSWWDENLKDSWLFDKIMLLSMKVNTGIMNEGWDDNKYMQAFKEKWLESKGM
jgi:hypothetical protein